MESDAALVAASDFKDFTWHDLGRGWTALRGDVVIVQESGQRSSVPIEMQFPPTYPKDEPRVYAMTDRFKREGHRHINDDGRFCLWTPEESQWNGKDPKALIPFLRHLVYFVENQLIFEVTGKWRGPERRRADDGRADYLCETFGCDTLTAKLAIDVHARGAGSIGRFALCPCKSGVAWKTCHRAEVMKIVRHIEERLRGKNWH